MLLQQSSIQESVMKSAFNTLMGGMQILAFVTVGLALTSYSNPKKDFQKTVCNVCSQVTDPRR